MQITRRLIVTNTLWSAAAQIGVMGINLLVLPLFIKNLGAELYGIWVLSGVVLGYLNVFDFGFTQGLQKYVAEARVNGDHQKLSEVVVSGFGLLCCIGLMLGSIFWIGATSIVEFFNIQQENHLIADKLLRISSLFCVVMWPLRIVDVVLNASMRIKELNFLNAIKVGGQSLVMLGMVAAAADVVLIKWATSVLMALCSACGLALVKKYVPEIRWTPRYFQIHQLQRMHKFSLGMFYSAVIGMFSIQIDSLIIGRFLTMGAVAIYAVTAKPFQLIQQIAGLIMQTVTPVTYTLAAQKDLFRIEKLVSQGARTRSLISIPCCIVAGLCMSDFIQIWVGEQFSETVVWARIFLFVPLLACLGIGANVCKAAGGIRLVNGLATVKIILNLVISIALIKPLGVGGPILGTVISNLILGDMTFFSLYCRRLGISSRRGYDYFMQILLAALTGGAIALLGMQFIDIAGFWGLLIKAFICVLVQFLFVGFFCFSIKEKKQVRAHIVKSLREWGVGGA